MPEEIENSVPVEEQEVVEVEPKKKPSRAMPRFTFSFTKKNIEQLEEIKEQLGLASLSETMRACIHATYTKTFPNYTRSNTSTPRVVSETSEPVSKVDSRTKKLEQERANRIATAINICENELDGVVATDENDKPTMCAYFQYDGRRRYKQEISIESVTPDLVKTQYLPNKERVMQLQKDGNVDYDVNEDIETLVGAE